MIAAFAGHFLFIVMIDVFTGSGRRSATYTSGSGSSRLVFEYVVRPGDDAACRAGERRCAFDAARALSQTHAGPSTKGAALRLCARTCAARAMS